MLCGGGGATFLKLCGVIQLDALHAAHTWCCLTFDLALLAAAPALYQVRALLSQELTRVFGGGVREQGARDGMG